MYSLCTFLSHYLCCMYRPMYVRLCACMLRMRVSLLLVPFISFTNSLFEKKRKILFREEILILHLSGVLEHFNDSMMRPSIYENGLLLSFVNFSIFNFAFVSTAFGKKKNYGPRRRLVLHCNWKRTLMLIPANQSIGRYGRTLDSPWFYQVWKMSLHSEKQ